MVKTRAGKFSMKEALQRLLRVGLSGGFATCVNLGTMAVMVRLGYTPQQANIPSLAAGTVFQFLGNRYFVFKAQEGRVERQAAAFILCEAVAFGLNVAFFDWVSRQTDIHYTFIRLGTTFVVFAGFSYPLWHWIFRKEKISPRK